MQSPLRLIPPSLRQAPRRRRVALFAGGVAAAAFAFGAALPAEDSDPLARSHVDSRLVGVWVAPDCEYEVAVLCDHVLQLRQDGTVDLQKVGEDRCGRITLEGRWGVFIKSLFVRLDQGACGDARLAEEWILRENPLADQMQSGFDFRIQENAEDGETYLSLFRSGERQAFQRYKRR